jgi:hypothetical protein
MTKVDAETPGTPAPKPATTNNPNTPGSAATAATAAVIPSDAIGIARRIRSVLSSDAPTAGPVSSARVFAPC